MKKVLFLFLFTIIPIHAMDNPPDDASLSAEKMSFHCDMCKKEVHCIDVKNHLETIHLVCGVCREPCNTPQEARAHRLRHSDFLRDIEILKCSKCGVEKANAAALKAHVAKRHRRIKAKKKAENMTYLD